MRERWREQRGGIRASYPEDVASVLSLTRQIE